MTVSSLVKNSQFHKFLGLSSTNRGLRDALFFRKKKIRFFLGTEVAVLIDCGDFYSFKMHPPAAKEKRVPSFNPPAGRPAPIIVGLVRADFLCVPKSRTFASPADSAAVELPVRPSDNRFSITRMTVCGHFSWSAPPWWQNIWSAFFHGFGFEMQMRLLRDISNDSSFSMDFECSFQLNGLKFLLAVPYSCFFKLTVYPNWKFCDSTLTFPLIDIVWCNREGGRSANYSRNGWFTIQFKP